MRNGQKVEVQIRTNWMHSIAQYGTAAHWLYKDERYGGAGVKKVFNKYYKVAWMDIIKEWQDEIHNSTEFVDAIRRELLGKRVFVFLRDGKILNLSRGATVIDAAFAIHTEVGLKMSAAQINGQNMPISYELQNGDVVSIITAEEGRPSLDWMRFARSRSTRAKLRGYFRSQQRTANVQKGWLYVHDFMDQHAALVINRLGHLPSDDELLDMMPRRGVGDNFAWPSPRRRTTRCYALPWRSCWRCGSTRSRSTRRYTAGDRATPSGSQEARHADAGLRGAGQRGGSGQRRRRLHGLRARRRGSS